MNVAQYVAKFLVSKNIECVFGYQGGAILKLIDEIIATTKIRYVQNYNEQGSALAADAYARVTGNVGVALGTSGPGATNLITGIANAYLDSIPTLFITGQDYKANILAPNQARQNGFQDLDIALLVKSITKYSVMICEPSDIRYELEKAYYYATNGRPGAVLVDIPIDVQFAEISEPNLLGYEHTPSAQPRLKCHEVISCIQKALRPVLLVGGGVKVSNAVDELRALALKTGIPVVATLNGLDIIEGNYGFAGLHGNTYANLAVQNCDLLLALGVRFGQRQVGKTPEKYTSAKVIHIDIDESELGRIFPDELAIKADIKEFLGALNANTQGIKLNSYKEWIAVIEKWKQEYSKCQYLNNESIDPVKAVEVITSLCRAGTVYTSDVGQNQMWVAQGFRAKEGDRLLNSCSLGAMGYSLPASIGASYAEASRPVVCFTGDGGLQMNLQELILVGHKQLPIKCVVFNNNTLGMMREVQERYYNGNYHGANTDDFVCVDLEAIAKAFSLRYLKIETLSDLKSCGEIFLDLSPYIIDIKIQFDSKLSNRYDETHIFQKERLS